MNTLDRRTLLRSGLALVGGGVLAGCGRRGAAAFVQPDSEPVRAVEARRGPGRVRDVRLAAISGELDLGGRTVHSWSYDGVLPGPEIRVSAGEVIRARLVNQLPAETTIHWHGLALRNNADGVPGVTQAAVRAGSEFTYEFTAAQPGTYWFHPHTGVKLDRGLYAPLIVEDPREPLSYDAEWVVVVDDWLDGVTGTPEEVLAGLTGGMGRGGMPGMGHGKDGTIGAPAAPGGGHMMTGASSALLGGDAGDVRYPHYLLNGRLPTAPATFTGRPGMRLRLRLVNAGGDTAFRVALAGHRMTVTHTDGYAVQPVDTDALLIGMGERYDVLLTLRDGVFPLVALAEGKNATALGLVRTGSGAPPPATIRPPELDRRILSYRLLEPTDQARLPHRDAERTIRLELTGGMHRYDWSFNGKRYDPKTIEPVRDGERVRLAFVNRTTMWHPVHLHGHTFALDGDGPRKDTAIVLPGQSLNADFDADNPGIWMIHCHNVYHGEAGMMTLLGYLT